MINGTDSVLPPRFDSGDTVMPIIFVCQRCGSRVLSCDAENHRCPPGMGP